MDEGPERGVSLGAGKDTWLAEDQGEDGPGTRRSKDIVTGRVRGG